MVFSRLVFVQLVLFCAVFVPSLVWAGAWTRTPGDGLLIVNYSFYDSNRIYDNAGHKTKQTRYMKDELSPYVEYGLWDGLTVGGTTSLQYVWQRGSATVPSYIQWGHGDTTLFARQRLWQEGGFVASIEPLVKLPSPFNSDDLPRLGGKDADAGATLAGGYGFSAFGLDHFVDLQAGWRYRFGDPHNQRRYAATLGMHVTERWLLMPQLFATQRTNAAFTPHFTQSSHDDYNQTTIQLSAVYRLTDTYSAQLGAYRHIDGKNAGAGNGFLLSVWMDF